MCYLIFLGSIKLIFIIGQNGFKNTKQTPSSYYNKYYYQYITLPILTYLGNLLLIIIYNFVVKFYNFT
jgi:hypothetical protein